MCAAEIVQQNVCSRMCAAECMQQNVCSRRCAAECVHQFVYNYVNTIHSKITPDTCSLNDPI